MNPEWTCISNLIRVRNNGCAHRIRLSIQSRDCTKNWHTKKNEIEIISKPEKYQKRLPDARKPELFVRRNYARKPK